MCYACSSAESQYKSNAVSELARSIWAGMTVIATYHRDVSIGTSMYKG